MTDVSAGLWPPCWCPSRWAPAWRLHRNIYKFGENVSPYIVHKKNYCYLNLGDSIPNFFLFPDSGLNLLKGFDFLFWSILNGVPLKTSNSCCGLSLSLRCRICRTRNWCIIWKFLYRFQKRNFAALPQFFSLNFFCNKRITQMSRLCLGGLMTQQTCV